MASVALVLCWMKSGLSLSFCQGSLAAGRAEVRVLQAASVEEAAPYMLKELGQLSGEREDASAWCACFGQVGTWLESPISWDTLVATLLEVLSVA